MSYKHNSPAIQPQSVNEAYQQFEQLTNGQTHPQLAALNFDAIGDVRALDHYFPIVKMLSESEIESFYQLVQSIAEHPNFYLQLIGSNKTNITAQLPKSAY